MSIEVKSDRLCIVATLEEAVLNSSGESYGVIFIGVCDIINKSHYFSNASLRELKNVISKGCVQYDSNDSIIYNNFFIKLINRQENMTFAII